MSDSIPYGGRVIRNLIYHIWPVKNQGIWQSNVSHLLRRMDQFDGQRIVSVVTDGQTDTLDTVRKAFRGTVKDFMHFKNDPVLGEAKSFYDLMHRVENIDERQLTYYCHAKGVKYKPSNPQPMVSRWVEVMHSNLLDYPKLVNDSLLFNAMCGTFLKSGNAFGTLPPSWHYAGTFFWFRNLAVFGQPLWHRTPRQWWGTEAWPGIICPQNLADCMLMPGKAGTMSLYARGYWRDVVDPMWKSWQIDHASLHRHNSYREVINTLRSLDSKKVIVSGPQRSGTTIAAQIIAKDMKLPYIDETAFKAHDVEEFWRIVKNKESFVIQAPGMAHIVHQAPCHVVWMRRDLHDIIRSEKRVGWKKYEELERDKYFDHTRRPMAVVKNEAWDKFQRVDLGMRAFDLEYDTLQSHPMWVDSDTRKAFGERQTSLASYPV